MASISSYIPRVTLARAPGESPAARQQAPASQQAPAGPQQAATRPAPIGTRSFLEVARRMRAAASGTAGHETSAAARDGGQQAHHGTLKKLLAALTGKGIRRSNAQAGGAAAYGKNIVVYSARELHDGAKVPAPSKDAQAVRLRFVGAAQVKVVSGHMAPFLFENNPPAIAKTEHATQLDPYDAADSVFMMGTSLDDMDRVKSRIPPFARIVISSNDTASVHQQVSYLAHVRPDLNVFGHASRLHDPENLIGAKEAFTRVANVLGGAKDVVTHALNRKDSKWISQNLGIEVAPGTAITAVFDRHGGLDRRAFRRALEEVKVRHEVPIVAGAATALVDPARVLGRRLANAGMRKSHAAEKEAAGSRSPQAAGDAADAPAVSRRWQALKAKIGREAMKGYVKNIGLKEQDEVLQSVQSAVELFRNLNLENVPVIDPPAMPKDLFSVVGDSMVFGDGNIGLALVETLGGNARVSLVRRKPAGDLADLAGAGFQASLDAYYAKRKPDVSHLGSPQNPIAEYGLEGLPDYWHPEGGKTRGPDAKTVFLTASVPKPVRGGKVVTDRPAMMRGNLEVMVGALRKIPASVGQIQIITNPSTEMAFAAWLLRPDFPQAAIVCCHAGTDTTRQRARVTDPDRPDSYFTLGPHEKEQVNVDFEAQEGQGAIDDAIPTMGGDITRRSGGQAATVTTGLASLNEAYDIYTRKPGSYAVPLTADEAGWLTRFVRGLQESLGQPTDFQIQEGAAITIPRKGDMSINKEVLEKAKAVNGFAERAIAAASVVEQGRTAVLDAVASLLEGRRLENGHRDIDIVRYPALSQVRDSMDLSGLTPEDRRQFVLDHRDKLLRWLVSPVSQPSSRVPEISEAGPSLSA